MAPIDESPAYSQNLPTPMNLKENITVEVDLLHKYGNISTFKFSKYESPILAPRIPNGNLRLIVDIQKINKFISDDYINNNHSVSTLTNATQH